jgi:hypothetical protein
VDDFLQPYREAVAEAISEPVIGACPFSRRGLMTNKLLGHLGALPYLLGRSQAKAQAGGLPQQFVVAVTPTKVRAFQCKLRAGGRGKPKLGDEVKAWDRDAIRITSQPGGPYQTDVTIEAAGDGERVECRVGRTDLSEAFLRLLADPHATG